MENTEEAETKVYHRSEYANKDFWNDRFRESDGFFDWYADWDQLSQIKDLVSCDSNPKILMVGCGNSKLSEQMYKDGYTDIVNIDISDVVISKMTEIYSTSCPLMKWVVADATNMPEFESDTFDIVIDKGTYDALACDKDTHPEKYLIKEMMRVVKPNSYLIEISNGTPEKQIQAISRI